MLLIRQARYFASVGARSKRGGGAAAGTAGARVGVESSAEKRLTMLLRPVAPPPERSAEERARLRALMIRYGKLKRRQHLEIEAKVNRFARAKWAAIDALPVARRIEALHTKERVMPINRPLWTDTPPIPGFNSGEMAKSG